MGVVEVTYVSLRSVYSITDTYQFQLGSASAECSCDCPGGASACAPHTDPCQAHKLNNTRSWKKGGWG